MKMAGPAVPISETAGGSRETSSHIRARRLRVQSRVRDALITACGAASIFALWYGVVAGFHVQEFIAPLPTRVVQVFVSEWPLISKNFVPTMMACVLGFTFGSLTGVLVAITFIHFSVVRTAYFPIAVFFNTIPILAIAPILVLIFGLGLLPKVIVAGLICFFPVLVNMLRGLEAVRPSELELMRMLSASEWEVFLRLRLPRALPYLFSALRIVATTSVIGAIVGEWIGSDAGLGALIIQSAFNYRSPLLYATIFASSSLAIAQFSLVVILERRIIRWVG